MEIIKELHDDKKNVALIINPKDDTDNIFSDIAEETEMQTQCYHHIFTNYFRKPESIDEELASNMIVDFTLRWVSYNLILCYFNSTYSESFENKIVKAVNIAAIDEDQSKLPNNPLYQFRKYHLSSNAKNLEITPFIKNQIYVHDVVWSK